MESYNWKAKSASRRLIRRGFEMRKVYLRLLPLAVFVASSAKLRILPLTLQALAEPDTI